LIKNRIFGHLVASYLSAKCALFLDVTVENLCRVVLFISNALPEQIMTQK
jgi:hypothetical protein